MDELNRPHRGQIYHITGDPSQHPVGSEIWPDRPGLVISNETINATSTCVTVVYLTKSFKKKASPCHIPVETGKGRAIAQCEQVFSVDKSRLASYIGEITDMELQSVTTAVALGLGITGTENPTGIFRKWENYVRKYGIEIADEQRAVRRRMADARMTGVIAALATERDSYKNLYDAATERLKTIASMANG